jgi:hypothetical protein
MKKFASVAAIPLFAGFLWAQSDQVTKTETTTTKTTYNGTLLDAGCLNKHTEHKETTSTSSPGQTSTSTRTETTTEVTECPVTTTTTTFALQTPEGKYVRFDEPSNTRIVEVVKSKKEWNDLINDRKPVKVRIVGAPNGDVVVMESIR